VLGGGWLWLRDSPLAAVERVHLAGVRGADAGAIEAALRAAARRTSTLDVNVAALRAAVAPFRVVRTLSVRASFPHELSIHVVEQPPVAALTEGGVRTAVAADGAVLGTGLLSSQSAPLASIAATGPPPPLTGRVRGATARAELTILGAAPRVLLGWVERVFRGREGLTVVMRGGGVQLYFGDATRPRAKWLAAARVLADPGSAGAAYVDVRAPERPAAGGGAIGTATASGAEGASGAESTSGTATGTPAVGAGSTSAALERALAEAVTGSAGVTPGAAPAGGATVTPATPTTLEPAAGSTATPTTPTTGEPSPVAGEATAPEEASSSTSG